MYDFNDNLDVSLFKTRLQETRKRKNLKQAAFAEALHFDGRSSIGNWESQKSQVLPSLASFVSICKVLDVEPNYLLGVSEVASESDQAISEAIGLSSDNVRQLRNDQNLSTLINYMLSSGKLNELINRVRQICYYGLVSEAQKNTFTADALKKIQKAFNEFYRCVFPLDMNVERFAEYVRRAFKWEPSKMSIDDFIRSVITENEYQNILFEHPDFEVKIDREKYDILIEDLAETSYDYMMGQPIMELSEHEIATVLDSIVKDYIRIEIANSKEHLRRYGSHDAK